MSTHSLASSALRTDVGTHAGAGVHLCRVPGRLDMGQGDARTGVRKFVRACVRVRSGCEC
jgi:hypothetical protein